MPFRLCLSSKLYYLGNEQKIGRYIWHPTAIRVERCSLAGGITDRPGGSLSVGIWRWERIWFIHGVFMICVIIV
jgi:hypothetical protein